MATVSVRRCHSREVVTKAHEISGQEGSEVDFTQPLVEVHFPNLGEDVLDKLIRSAERNCFRDHRAARVGFVREIGL